MESNPQLSPVGLDGGATTDIRDRGTDAAVDVSLEATPHVDSDIVDDISIIDTVDDEVVCIPDCEGKECGDDGCGGECCGGEPIEPGTFSCCDGFSGGTCSEHCPGWGSDPPKCIPPVECIQPCIEECPEGWTCKVAPSLGTEVAFYCFPEPLGPPCQPCDTDADCPGGVLWEVDRCAAVLGDVPTCVSECSAIPQLPCPPWHSCVPAETVTGEVLDVCVPDPGQCECLPEVETCDDIDNDCDGETDEGVTPEDQGLECPSAGVCEGATITVACAVEPACDFSAVPDYCETDWCDGEDNNCNGWADEWFCCYCPPPEPGAPCLGLGCFSGPPDCDGDTISDEPYAIGDGFAGGDNCPCVNNPAQINTDGDDKGDACDDDDDNDGIPDKDDNCSLVFNFGQENCDSDSWGNACDDDDDNDGIPDGWDCAPCDPWINPDMPELCDLIDNNCNGWFDEGFPDTDSDGLKDCVDEDDDNDGVQDDVDNCPLVVNPDQQDCDGDGIGFACDTDEEKCDTDPDPDNCPLVSNPDQIDTDGDGEGDACDTDDDDDGVLDEDDCEPLDAGIPSCEGKQCGDDGCGDTCGVCLNDCAAPIQPEPYPDPSLCIEGQCKMTYNGAEEECDGIDNNCNEIIDEGFPDTDVDGLADCLDNDDDNDSWEDDADNCPLVFNSDQADCDEDGAGDVCDDDDNNDGIPDTMDNCPCLMNLDQLDLDGDGEGDACDDDDDGDGVLDVEDCDPLDPALPDCFGKECGDDGCGGLCGTCQEGSICTDSGTCHVES